ncbi:uncharacterized protein LOC142354266 [Convolutriloba macropyga]|uniref:uncharacterized protein LOC142354266 n=1 Tax=Convolutriloba macropyga TaxID=536237 RepID=UPI003F51C34A
MMEDIATNIGLHIRLELCEKEGTLTEPILQLFEQYFQHLERNDKTFNGIAENRPSVAEIQDAIKSNLYRLFTACDSSTKQPVGFLGLHFSYSTFNGCQAYISDVFVGEDHRGQNIGQILIEFALKTIKASHNCTNYILLVGADCKGYFEKLGAENVNIVEAFYQFVLPENYFKTVVVQ